MPPLPLACSFDNSYFLLLPLLFSSSSLLTHFSPCFFSPSCLVSDAFLYLKLCLTLPSYIFSAKITPIKTCRPYHIFSTLSLLCWHLLIFPVLVFFLPLLFPYFFFSFLFYRSMAPLSLRENAKSYPPPLHSFLLNCVFIAAAVH